MDSYNKKRILFVSPWKGPVGTEDMFAAPNFGLYRIKFYLEDRFTGVDVDIIDPNIQDVDFSSHTYDFIGFSMTHSTLEHDLSLVYRAKKEAPGSVLIAGGVEATFIYRWLFEASPIDCVVLGEGEEIMENILSAYDSSKGVASIGSLPGVAVRNVEEGIKKMTFAKPLNQDNFSSISMLFDFSRVPYREYWRTNSIRYRNPDPLTINSIRIFTGNYCPHNCSFCSSTNFLDFSYFGEYGRSKKVKVVTLAPYLTLEMVKNILLAYPDTSTIIFDDDNFLISPNRVLEICRGIIELKASKSLPDSLTFICQARADNFIGKQAPETLSLMKECGFRMIMFGVESFSKSVLEELGKNTDINLVRRALLLAEAAGIKPLIYIILFSPRSSKNDVLTTIRAALDYAAMGMEISVYPLVMDIPGCHYQKMDGLARSPKEVPIFVEDNEVASISKSEWLYPIDPEVAMLAKNSLEKYPEYESFFKDKFAIQHIPGRIYSFIIFYAVCDILDCAKEKKRILDIFGKLHSEAGVI